MIAELTTTHHMVDDIEPQDEAMEVFRQQFPLTYRCNVTNDGKLMVYSINGKSSAWYRSAKNIINALNLPLVAELVQDITGTFIHIIYTP